MTRTTMTRTASFFATLLLITGMAWPCGLAAAAPPPGLTAQDLPALVMQAEVVLVGTVDAVESGRVAGEGEARLQFEDITVRVEKPLKGNPDSEVVVELVSMPPGTEAVGLGPPYRPGERYVLFLMPGEGHRYVSHPQGRFLLESGRVQATQPGPVAESLDGMDEAAFIREIEAIVAGTTR